MNTFFMRPALNVAFALVVGNPVFAQASPISRDEMTAIVRNLVDIGQAALKDSAASAQDLRTAVEELLNNPSDETLAAAREAWRSARIPFEQGEVFLLSSPLSREWMDQVNAWPVNPSFIDYVDDQTMAPQGSIIGSESMKVNGTEVDVSRISPHLIAQSLHHADNDPANIASGYHVIEFLLWGQDSSGPDEKGVDEGAGQRPFTDFDLENCTGGNCARRGEYLYASVNLLIDDLNEMAADWQVTGRVRRQLIGDPKVGLNRILQAMGDLSYSFLAGDRLQKTLLLHDPGMEVDQFSNLSHVTYLLNARGLAIVYFGEYSSMERKLIQGPSIADIMEKTNAAFDEEFRSALGMSMARIRMMMNFARDEEAFDLMIGAGNERGNGLVQAAIHSLAAQKGLFEKMADELGVGPIRIAPSPALDDPASIVR